MREYEKEQHRMFLEDSARRKLKRFTGFAKPKNKLGGKNVAYASWRNSALNQVA